MAWRPRADLRQAFPATLRKKQAVLSLIQQFPAEVSPARLAVNGHRGHCGMLEQDLEDIRAGLVTGKFQNEAAVSQGIVLRLLGGLGWPTYDTSVVSPEFPLQGTRVDFALCHPAGKPRIFIEVKQVGLSDGAERQLFQYAFHAGVPVVILTDGREWSFFLPGEFGDYGERRVYKLDVVERDTAESILRMTRYLDFESVKSGAAYAAARADYEDVARSRQIAAALPLAWRKLVDDEDELLLELLADQTESLRVSARRGHSRAISSRGHPNPGGAGSSRLRLTASPYRRQRPRRPPRSATYSRSRGNGRRR